MSMTYLTIFILFIILIILYFKEKNIHKNKIPFDILKEKL